LVREIGWTHNLIIMENCKDDLEREFYLRMTRKFGWTKNVLLHQIENRAYEKTLLNQTNFDQTAPRIMLTNALRFRPNAIAELEERISANVAALLETEP
jgi:predicted nuclease of restriction endonuclease-like (RecB) superfamily